MKSHKKEHKEQLPHKSHKTSKKKHKKDKHKKHKKHRKRDSSASSSSSSSGSDSDGGCNLGGSALSLLERERAAVQAARYILTTQPGVRKSFRDLLWELDNGRAVGLTGVPDAVLRSQLQYTLDMLGLKCTKGQYWLPSGAPTALSIIGTVFDEPLRQAPAPPAGMTATATAAVTAAAAATEHPAAPAPAPAAAAGLAPRPVVRGPQLPRAAAHGQEQQQEDEPGAGAGQQAGAGADVVGPAGPPVVSDGGQPTGSSSEPDGEQQQQGEGAESAADAAAAAAAEADAEATARQRRTVGPAAPSAELLAAAAAYHAEIEAAGGYEAAEEPLIGPPPPEFVDEADAAPADAREAQVVRVLRVLREAAADAAAGPAKPDSAGTTAAAAAAADPYAVLGVERTADSGTIRKTYWRLSLLVHPDKCGHPAAQEVFQAVSKAAQLLQDAQQRKQLDTQQAEAELRKQAMAAAAAAEREVAWKTARGEAVPAELAAALAAAKADSAGPAVRESWMTDLPSQQRSAAAALAGLSQVSQTSFSRFGTRQPGDTSAWTDTPQQRAMRAAGLLTDSSSTLALTAGSAAGAGGSHVEGGGPVSAELVAAMAKYQQQHRQKSLMEQHAEQKAQAAKKKEKDKKEKQKDKEKDKDGKGQKRKATGEAEKEADWVGKHPWQPFDREKDMEVTQMKPKGAADMLKAAGSLSNRFSSGGR